MSLASRIMARFGYVRVGNAGRPRPGRVTAKYDAAHAEENRRHWKEADDLAVNAAANPAARRTLRMRGRHEQANNAYVDGALQTLAGDTVGFCPSLQMQTEDANLNRAIETEFGQWMNEVRVGRDLRTMVEAVCASGEIFGMIVQNPRLKNQVKVQMQLVEADQCATPDIWRHLADPRRVDGIVFDAFNNPLIYHILDRHPGDTASLASDPLSYREVPAEDMIHLYRTRRPGQRRGVPRLTSSLQLTADRRGYRQSTVAAARVAAELGAFTVESETAADGGDVPDPFEVVEVERGMLNVMPAGWKAKQMRPEQPSTSFREFDSKLVAEQARPLCMPSNVALADSADMNYASGRMDYQTYDRSIIVDRGDLEREVLSVLLVRWLSEAVMIPGFLPVRARRLAARAAIGGLPRHAWLWTGRDHVDPAKEATADKIGLESNTRTLAEILAKRGVDYETHVTQLQRERRDMERVSPRQILNGPQVTAATGVLTNVASGSIEPETAVGLLVMLGFGEERANEMVARERARQPDPVAQRASRARRNGSASNV